jgi:hypothetical protein
MGPGEDFVAWENEESMLVVGVRVDDLEETLAEGRVACPSCGGILRPWGHGRARFVRELSSPGRWWRPRRAACSSCSLTHILLPAGLVPRRRDSVGVIGAALAAAASGQGHRKIAVELDRPASTVRGWLRRFRLNAEDLRQRAMSWLCELDVLAGPIRPTGSALADAVEALARAQRATSQRLGPVPAGGVWAEISLLAGGLLGPSSVR